MSDSTIVEKNGAVANPLIGSLSSVDENLVRVVSEQGRGRPVVILSESGCYREFAAPLFEELRGRTCCLRLEVAEVTQKNWNELTRRLGEVLCARNFRQVSFVAFGDAATLVQNMALTNLKFIRKLTLVDAVTRPHPTWLERLVNKIELALPLGLPLRRESESFDSRPFLHRIRCPVMVVSTSLASPELLLQSQILLSGLPTAWGLNLPENDALEALSSSVIDFQNVAARCPQ